MGHWKHHRGIAAECVNVDPAQSDPKRKRSSEHETDKDAETLNEFLIEQQIAIDVRV